MVSGFVHMLQKSVRPWLRASSSGRSPIATRASALLQGLVDRMRRVIEERAAEMADVPGGSSGLLVKTYKGKDAATAVYKFDAALVKGLRETCKQVAIEIGQWAEKRNVTLAGDLGVRILAARKRVMEREAAGK